MNNGDINTDSIKEHWVDSSKEDKQAMYAMFNAKSYPWALFIGHISVEKMLKAIYVDKYKKNAPFTHNLYRLAELCGLGMTSEIADWLDRITTFNIEARYDDYKREFYSICNDDFTELWIKRIEEITQWLKKQL